jgi:hypothetical protein
LVLGQDQDLVGNLNHSHAKDQKNGQYYAKGSYQRSQPLSFSEFIPDGLAHVGEDSAQNYAVHEGEEEIEDQEN